MLTDSIPVLDELTAAVGVPKELKDPKPLSDTIPESLAAAVGLK